MPGTIYPRPPEGDTPLGSDLPPEVADRLAGIREKLPNASGGRYGDRTPADAARVVAEEVSSFGETGQRPRPRPAAGPDDPPIFQEVAVPPDGGRPMEFGVDGGLRAVPVDVARHEEEPARVRRLASWPLLGQPPMPAPRSLVEFAAQQLEVAGVVDHDPAFAQAVVATVAVFAAFPPFDRDGYPRDVAVGLLGRLLRGQPLEGDVLGAAAVAERGCGAPTGDDQLAAGVDAEDLGDQVQFGIDEAGGAR